MRTTAVVLVLLLVGSGSAQEAYKPKPKDLHGELARPYTGKKVEIKGRVTGHGVDRKSNKWFFRCDLIDEKGLTTAVAIYLMFDDMKAAVELKGKLAEMPVVVARGICELYRDLAPRAPVMPVVLNATEILEYKTPKKP